MGFRRFESPTPMSVLAKALLGIGLCLCTIVRFPLMFALIVLMISS